ncbi:MAG: alkaline phosphatase family protein [Candidatus Hodarchaeota archaeon]
MKNRNIILGIDGVPFDLINNLSDKGVMPNFKQLKNEATFKVMKSSIPHVSSVSWSSIITGENPGEHGIYGFTEIIKNTYSMSFPNFNALKSKSFWHKKPEKKSVIINVPSTYPVKELNGIHIAGFVALDLEKGIYPKNLIPKLKEIKYEIDIDVKLAKQQSKDFFFKELFRILKIREKTFNFLWNECNWDNFLAVITGSDRINHFLWHVYEDDTNQYHYRFIEYFHEIDDIIGNIKSKLKEEDTFIILSDHGMERITQNVNLNTYLENQGYLSLSENFKKYNRITNGSKAFVLDPGRVYLNKKNRYPNGTVRKENEKEIIEDLKKLFDDLKFKNQKVIKKIYEKQEIYSGKMIEAAPDLVLIENKGFNLKGAIGKAKIFEKEKIFSGKHNENAFLLINRDIDLKEPTVEDIVGLMG